VRQRKRKTKFFTFLIIPDNEKKTKSLKLKAGVVRFSLVLLVAILVLIIMGASSYWKVAELALDYQNLQEENKTLKEGLARLEEVQNDLSKLKQIDQKLRSALSGYVNVNEENGGSNPDDAVKKVEELLDVPNDRSIFNFIPDIYPVDGYVTRGFEDESLLGDAHFGIDIAGSKGLPIKATAAGVVIFSGWTYEEGYVIIIKHKLDYYSFYKHNLQNLCQEWETVKKGQIIALLGDTGKISSGPHLHLEIWRGTTPIDPAKYLRKN
jgi:murein DD-endopeptidase MepM/ murein hydrolase activator NlpD